MIVCEQLGRYDTIGIDLFGMNANDVICVGADPIALLDYIAVEEANPEVLEQIGIGLRAGAELAGGRSQAASWPCCPTWCAVIRLRAASTSWASAPASWTSTRS